MSRPGDYNLGTRLEALRSEMQRDGTSIKVREHVIELLDILLDAAPDKFLNNDRNYDRKPEDDR